MIVEPRPQNAAELFKLKERMMDVYNLSQRDADAVRVAEENRLDDVNFIEQMHYRNNDAYSSDNSRDYERVGRPQSPPFGDDNRLTGYEGFAGNRFNGELDIIMGDPSQRTAFEDREREREHEYHQRALREREEEEQHQRMLAMERDRERALEREQMMYEEQRRMDGPDRRLDGPDRRRPFDDQHYRQPSQGPPQQQYRFDDITFDGDRDRGFNRSALQQNRRGRGAFRRGPRR